MTTLVIYRHDCHMRYLPSPHYNDRPLDTVIDLIVLHAISLPASDFDIKHVEQLFLGTLDIAAHPSFADLEHVQVSAHFVVDRQGIITQFVPCEKRAWHAGVSCWQGREQCNDYAIGIEMIGDELQAFTPMQYQETARLCRTLMQIYPNIRQNRIVGHQDIAPIRKWDPGKQWDWKYFRERLAKAKSMNSEVK
ncbi:MAG: 1,6-anhydro-N-acetylmuramyl-L-alanine amidase AmpD [Mariprofundaceae bacterium]|nr:1,6-anhydro-N-acetylmuramyl-L-alanine amidase AmpD [Mariprofundaceae bacterium]